MLAVLSPSKSLDFETPPPIDTFTQPEFQKESKALVDILKKYTPAKLSKLMDISDKLAMLNTARYQDFSLPFTPKNAKQALFAFTGDVYEGLNAESFGKADIAYAQQHIRMLSGLYGLLKPLDLMQPYRLEMGTTLKNPRGKDLYAFWGDRITDALNAELSLHKEKVLINLASEEYFKAVNVKKLSGRLVNVVFKEHHKGQLKIIALFAKKARGMMAGYMARHGVADSERLRSFREGGYRFDPGLSDEKQWVFVR